MDNSQKLLFVATSVLTLLVQLEGVRINASLCPTNKLAPYRRAVSLEEQSRTLGLVYGLLRPGRPRPPSGYDFSDLQEQAQPDDPNDCGDVDDYDETDLSSRAPNKVNNQNGFGHNIPSNYPGRFWNGFLRPPQFTTMRPHRPTSYPSKPPYHSGGLYQSHVYRPPAHLNPSINIKPVHENTYDRPQDAYTPGVVGGLSGQVVGYPTVRPRPNQPSRFPNNKVTSQRPSNTIRFPDSDSNDNRRVGATSVLGSFIDLLFN